MSSFCFRLPGKTLVRKDMSFKTETSDCQLGWQPRVKKGRGFAQVAFPPLTPKFFLGFTAQVSSTGSTAQNHMFSHIFSHIATELLVDHYRDSLAMTIVRWPLDLETDNTKVKSKKL